METENQSLTILLAGASASLVLALLIIIFVVVYQNKLYALNLFTKKLQENQQKQLFQAVSQAENQERERVAANLHDDTGMNLSLLKQNILRQQTQLPPETAAQIQQQNIQLIDKTVADLSNNIFELSPRYLLKHGLSKSIQNDLGLLREGLAIQSTFSATLSEGHEHYFESQALINIYRLWKELLNNLVKHSKSTNMDVSLLYSKTKLQLNIRHNGIQLDNQMVGKLKEESKGFGLKSIEARLYILNAVINYSSAQHKALIELHIPFKYVPNN
ncbi:MAG: hypothetical protein MUF75_02665 [Bacteroidia bacterium]|jgi:signal transduction histidine kinase|nr:hypothetical protein [Bacteroidia bacterium]